MPAFVTDITLKVSFIIRFHILLCWKISEWQPSGVYGRNTAIKEMVAISAVGHHMTTRIANTVFHLSAFARFPALHCLSMIQETNYLVMDSMIELNDY